MFDSLGLSSALLMGSIKSKNILKVCLKVSNIRKWKKMTQIILDKRSMMAMKDETGISFRA